MIVRRCNATACCRPHVHGEEMVAPISKAINEARSLSDAPVVAVALRALQHLCEAEVSN